MSKVLINTETLTSIADAIREKNFSDNTYKPAEMPGAIKGIVGGSYDIKGLISGEIKELNIPYSFSTEGSLALRADAFSALPNVESITIEEGITKIFLTYSGSNAFLGTGRLSNNLQLTLPSTLKIIGKNVFEDCNYRMDELILPEGLEIIETDAFRYYAGSGVSPRAKKIVIPASVKTIGENAFNGVSFNEVYFKGTPESIGNQAFYEKHNPLTSGGYQTVTIYVPWSKGNGPAITGYHKDTVIVYDYNYND